MMMTLNVDLKTDDGSERRTESTMFERQNVMMALNAELKTR